LHIPDEETVSCQFRKVELGKDFGISHALLRFYSEHGRCARCGGPMDDWARHEACEPGPRRFRHTQPAGLEVALTYATYMASGALRGKEGQLRAAFLRQQRTKAAAGARTREEVRALLDLQERRCYYCFGSLEGPGGSVNRPGEKTTCHEDHYVSLRWGGGQSICNIVLACVACNSRKRDQHGDNFARDSLERAPQAASKGLLRIHQARADHPSRLVVVDGLEDGLSPIVTGWETGTP
jgi:hypothetical protein